MTKHYGSMQATRELVEICRIGEGDFVLNVGCGVEGGAHRIDLSSESEGRFERYGRWGIMRILLNMISMLLSDRKSRQFMKGGIGAVSRDLLDVVGYGVYAGRKG